MAEIEKNKVVGLRPATHVMVRKESKRLGYTQTDYVDAAVSYFAQRGLDPVTTQAREGQLIMHEVKRLGDRVFSYLVEQEKSIHIVVLEELIRSRVVQAKLLAQEQVLEALLRKKGDDYLALIRQQDEKEIESIVAEALQMLVKTGKGGATSTR